VSAAKDDCIVDHL